MLEIEALKDPSSRPADMLFQLECEVASGGGELPQQRWRELLPMDVTFSPRLMKAYAIYLYDEGKLEQAKPLLQLALRRFGREGHSEEMLSACAILGFIDIRLGDEDESKTLLRFLADELHTNGQSAEQVAEGARTLAYGGEWIGLSRTERMKYYETAVLGLAAQGKTHRSFEVWIEWLRICEGQELAAFTTEASRLFRQRFVWDPNYGNHLDALRWKEAMNEEKWETVSQLSRKLEKAPAGFVSREILTAAAMLAELKTGRADALETVRAWLEETKRDRGVQDLEIRAERLMLEAEYLIANKNRTAAQNKCEELEAVLNGSPFPELLRRAAVLRDRLKLNTDGWRKSLSIKERAAWKARCFHKFSLIGPGIELETLPWGRRKAQELLLYLLLRPGYSAAKEQVMEDVFNSAIGDELPNPKQTSNQLYVAAHQLKQVLRQHIGIPQAVAIRGNTVKLDWEWLEGVDVEQYETLIRVADQLEAGDKELSIEWYGKARGLYGPLVPNLQFIDWLDRLREQLEQKQIRLLQRMAEHHLKAGRQAEAEDLLREWMELAPADETACQERLKLLAGSGRNAEAKRIYLEFEQRLREEWNESPMAETRRILYKL